MRERGTPSSQVPALAKSKFCEVQYAVSNPAARAYSQRSGARWRSARGAVCGRPLQSTASEAAVVESSARICENPKRSGRSAFVKGVVVPELRASAGEPRRAHKSRAGVHVGVVGAEKVELRPDSERRARR